MLDPYERQAMIVVGIAQLLVIGVVLFIGAHFVMKYW
jgi:hypothetical protein